MHRHIVLTLNLLTTTIVAPPSNASKWQMGFNSAFKGLNYDMTWNFSPLSLYSRGKEIWKNSTQCRGFERQKNLFPFREIETQISCPSPVCSYRDTTTVESTYRLYIQAPNRLTS